MTQAPSIKEALELKPCPFCGGEPDIRTRMDEDIWTHNIVEWTGVHCVECDIGFEWPPGAEPDAKEQWNTRATLQPSGERREAIARIIEYWADWLVDAVAGATQDVKFLRGEPEEDIMATGAILANGHKAIKNAILASGLVRDEAYTATLEQKLADAVRDNAAIRADEREKCAKIAEQFGEPYALNTNTGAMMFRAQVSKIASAIRSARNGGAES
jgi:Lar family restriction alleviation protein